MAQNRRAFIFNIPFLMLAMSSLAATVVGCSAATVEAAIETYVPILLQALASITSLVPGLQGIAPIVALIKTGVADLIVALQDYKATPNETIAQQIAAIAQDITTQFANMLALLPGGSLVVGLVTLVIETLEGFIAQLPATIKKLTAVYHGTPISPIKRDSKQFKTAWNARVIAGGHPELELK